MVLKWTMKAIIVIVAIAAKMLLLSFVDREFRVVSWRKMRFDVVAEMTRW